MNEPLNRGLQRLLFRPESSWPLAIVRILLGTILLAWAVSMMFDVSSLLSENGLAPVSLNSDRWRPLDLATERSVWIALVALVIAALAVIAGFRPTLFLLLAFVLLLSIQRRNTLMNNSGDVILRDLLLLLALTPSGVALSVDRWRAHGRKALRTAPKVAPWGLRLMQLQMMVVYFIAFWTKRGELWANGTAVSTALRLEDLQRFAAPDALTNNVPVISVLTWSTLALELALGLLLWNSRFRLLLIPYAILLHLFIDAFMLVGFFSLTMIAGLMTFLDGEAVQRRINRRFGPSELPTEPLKPSEPTEPDAVTDAAESAAPSVPLVALDPQSSLV